MHIIFPYGYYLIIAENSQSVLPCFSQLWWKLIAANNIAFPFIGHTKEPNLSAFFAILVATRQSPLQQNVGRSGICHFQFMSIKKQMCLLLLSSFDAQR